MKMVRMTKIFDWLAEYCEARQFRLTKYGDKLRLAWLVGDKFRTAEFDDVLEVKRFVENRPTKN